MSTAITTTNCPGGAAAPDSVCGHRRRWVVMGLFGADIGIKLAEPDRERLPAEPGAGPFGPSERPMGGYVTLPASWSARKARRWIDTSLAHVASLPPKKAKSTGKTHR